MIGRNHACPTTPCKTRLLRCRGSTSTGCAREGDVFGLSCHEGNPDASAFDAKATLACFALQPDSVLVDIGCGEGTLLVQAADTVAHGRLIGILPTAKKSSSRAGISVITELNSAGLADAIGLPSGSADFGVCNGVLLLVPRPELALQEIARMQSPARPSTSARSHSSTNSPIAVSRIPSAACSPPP
jgi:hypothetical protein